MGRCVQSWTTETKGEEAVRVSGASKVELPGEPKGQLVNHDWGWIASAGLG